MGRAGSGGGTIAPGKDIRLVLTSAVVEVEEVEVHNRSRNEGDDNTEDEDPPFC